MAIRLRRFPVKLALFLGVVLVIVLLASLLNLSPDLSDLDARMLSGPREGNYHAIVEKLSGEANKENGDLVNVATGGSVENIRRLAQGCSAKFALVQDGTPMPKGSNLSLMGRLRKSESVFFIGKQAEQITRFAQLKGMRIGLGPAGSGTDHQARRIFATPDFQRLGMKLENYPVDQQLAMLESGELPLGVFVVDEDAKLIRDAIKRRRLQLASFENVDAVSRHFSFLSHGRIAAGQYDVVDMHPATDVRVFRVGTLILTNHCTDHAERVALLSLLSMQFPDFIQFNRAQGFSEDFRLTMSSQRFLENGGPGFADRHVPWLVSIMPPSNWVYVIMVISVFINLTTTWHRFRLWRLDANTDKADALVREVIGEHMTPVEMMKLEVEPRHAAKDSLDKLDRALGQLDLLRLKCRRQANSLLVPMGQEWIYRYTEQQMEETLTAMRDFRDRARALAEKDDEEGEAQDA